MRPLLRCAIALAKATKIFNDYTIDEKCLKINFNRVIPKNDKIAVVLPRQVGKIKIWKHYMNLLKKN